MNKKELKSKIKSSMEERGYLWKEPLNLYEDNINTLFTSSSTNVYLPMINNNSFSGSYVTIQPCLRTYYLKEYEYFQNNRKPMPYKSFFEIAGTMEEGRLSEEIIKAVFSLFINQFNFKPSGFYVVLPVEFQNYKDMIQNEIGIKNVNVMSKERFTKWHYGVDFLKGTGITAYIAHDGAVIQILDIIQILDTRFDKYYVESCFSLENLQVKDKDIDVIKQVFNKSIDSHKIYEMIFYDSLIAVCEIYTSGIKLPKWQEDYQRSHIFKRFIKYLLVYGNYLGYSFNEIYDMVVLYIQNQYGCKDIVYFEKLRNILARVTNNIEINTKHFLKYLKKNDGKYSRVECKKKFGVLDLQIDSLL